LTTWKAAQEYVESLQVSYQNEIKFDELIRLFSQRLWHQLTDELDNFIHLPAVRNSINLVEFYTRFIKPSEEKLNQLRLVRLVLSISEQVIDNSEKLILIKSLVELPKVSSTLDASIVARSHLATLYVTLGNFEDAKVILDATRKDLNDLNISDTFVYSSFYYACTEYNRIKGIPDEYFKNALQYLEYTDITQLADKVRIEFAYNFGLSALIGKEIFNYGEILEHPIIDALRGSKFIWLGEALSIFNRGNIPEWKEFQETYKDTLNNIQELVSNHQILEQKIAIMSIINLFFGLDSKERRLPLSTLCTRIGKNVEEVEMILMRCMSLGFIRGQIDQVTSFVEIEWVQPRVLNLDQISRMGVRFRNWIQNVDSLLNEMESY